MSSSAIVSSFALVVILIVGAVAALPAGRAQAHDTGLPFDFKFPQDVQKTSFSNTWGARRSGGRGHKGTDLMADKGTEVYAFADGTINKIGDSRRPGRYLIIEHAGGWDTYYIHLNNDNPGTDDGAAPWDLTVAPGLEVGSQVSAGQLIGWVGDSGNAEGSGSHTHFELLHNGRNLNPYHALVEAFERELADLLRWYLILERQGENELAIH